MPYVRKKATHRIDRAQLLLIATAVGTVAALLVYLLLARATQGAQPQMRAIVVAAQELSPRQVITASMLRTVQWRRADCPAGVFGSSRNLIGDVTAQVIRAGQPVTNNEITSRASLAGAAPQIPADLRAVCISLDPAGGSAGFLEDGDHVDVFATFDQLTAGPVARLIVSNAQLLGLNTRSGASAEAGGSAASSATLVVSPKEAEALALASAHGRLTLALRGLGDETPDTLPELSSNALSQAASSRMPATPRHPIAPVTMPQLAPLPPLAAAAITPSTAPLPQIAVVRGTQKTLVTVGP